MSVEFLITVAIVTAGVAALIAAIGMLCLVLGIDKYDIGAWRRRK